jgi:hypothetical protein
MLILLKNLVANSMQVRLKTNRSNSYIFIKRLSINIKDQY